MLPHDKKVELEIYELEERLEFGAALLDSDLQADTDTNCSNLHNCGQPNAGCLNGSC